MACSGTTWPRCPTSRPRSGRRPGTLAGVSAFQVHISDHEITTPGDAPNVLVAMNPAALRNELPRLEAGGTLIVNVDAFEERNLTKAGYTDNPLTDGSLDGYTVFEVPMTSLTQGAVEPLGVKPRDAERSKNLFALGPGVVDVHAARGADAHVDRAEVQRQAAGARREHGRLQGGPRVRRDGRALRPPLRGRPGQADAGHLHEHQRQHGAGVGPDRGVEAVGAAPVPRVVPDHPGLRHPPRAVEAQELRRAHAAGRGRDRRDRRGHRRGLRRPPGRHHHERSRHGPEVRVDGPGR